MGELQRCPSLPFSAMRACVTKAWKIWGGKCAISWREVYSLRGQKYSGTKDKSKLSATVARNMVTSPGNVPSRRMYILTLTVSPFLLALKNQLLKLSMIGFWIQEQGYM